MTTATGELGTVTTNNLTPAKIRSYLDSGYTSFNFNNLFTFGALLRRQMRPWFDAYGLLYTEYKGVLESNFVVHIRTAQQAKNYVELIERLVELGIATEA